MRFHLSPILSPSLDNIELVVMHSSREFLPPLINTVRNLFMKTQN